MRAFLCETWRKNTLKKKNCIQREFFKHGGIPKKTELKCLQLHHEVAGTQTFCMQSIL